MAWKILIGKTYGNRRPHWAVNTCHGKDGPWVIQRAHPTEAGYRYDAPIHKNIQTKREAIAIKKGLP